MEHTDNRAIAERIAMDHLTEDPRYYVKLARMEKNRVSGRDCGGWAPEVAGGWEQCDPKTIPKGANRVGGDIYKGLSTYDLQVAGLLAQDIATDDPIASAVEIIQIFKKRPQWKWISEAKPSTAAEMILDLIYRETKQVRRG
jgi:hypothetical protein